MGSKWTVKGGDDMDRYGNQIELTNERWRHIVTYHPELEDCQDDVLGTIDFI